MTDSAGRVIYEGSYYKMLYILLTANLGNGWEHFLDQILVRSLWLDLAQINIYTSAPHILTPAKLVGDAGEEDEEVLQKEGHPRVGGIWVESFGLIIMNILSKQDVGRTLIYKSRW